MICKGCEIDFEPRGPGKPQKYHSPQCRKGQERRVWRLGTKAAEARRPARGAQERPLRGLAEPARVRSMKDRAADELAHYNEVRRKQIADGTGRPLLASTDDPTPAGQH